MLLVAINAFGEKIFLLLRLDLDIEVPLNIVLDFFEFIIYDGEMDASIIVLSIDLDIDLDFFVIL